MTPITPFWIFSLGDFRVEHHCLPSSRRVLLCATPMDARHLWPGVRPALRVHVVLLAESHPFCNVGASNALGFSVRQGIRELTTEANMDYCSEMLRAVTSISKQYPSTFAMAFLGLFVQTAYSVYFICVITGCYEMYYDTTTRKTPGKLKA